MEISRRNLLKLMGIAPLMNPLDLITETQLSDELETIKESIVDIPKIQELEKTMVTNVSIYCNVSSRSVGARTNRWPEFMDSEPLETLLLSDSESEDDE